MEIYLDNAATTRCYEEVRDIVVKTMMEDYGNPSPCTERAWKQSGIVRGAAQALAGLLKVQEKEI